MAKTKAPCQTPTNDLHGQVKHEATARSLALANCSGFSLAELFDQKCEKIPPPSTKSS